MKLRDITGKLFNLIKKKFVFSITLMIIVVFLSLSSLYGYLLFHKLSVIFSIVIMAAIFIIAWKNQGYIKSYVLYFQQEYKIEK